MFSVSVVYPFLYLTTNEGDLSKLSNSPPPNISKMNVISYDQAAFIVLENLNRNAQPSDLIDQENVIFIGTKVQDDRFYRLGRCQDLRIIVTF